MKHTLTTLLALTLLTVACKKNDGTTNTPASAADRRTKFIKTWSGTRSCVFSGAGAYQYTISKNGNDTSRVIISNILNEGHDIVGIMNGDYHIEIPNQQYGSSASNAVSGYLDFQTGDNTLQGSVQLTSQGDACTITGF